MSVAAIRQYRIKILGETKIKMLCFICGIKGIHKIFAFTFLIILVKKACYMMLEGVFKCKENIDITKTGPV